MRVEQLNCVNYDFNWQIVYNYADDVAPLLPAGTIMHVISWHDNSAATSTTRIRATGSASATARPTTCRATG